MHTLVTNPVKEIMDPQIQNRHKIYLHKTPQHEKDGLIAVVDCYPRNFRAAWETYMDDEQIYKLICSLSKSMYKPNRLVRMAVFAGEGKDRIFSVDIGNLDRYSGELGDDEVTYLAMNFGDGNSVGITRVDGSRTFQFIGDSDMSYELAHSIWESSLFWGFELSDLYPELDQFLSRYKKPSRFW